MTLGSSIQESVQNRPHVPPQEAFNRLHHIDRSRELGPNSSSLMEGVEELVEQSHPLLSASDIAQRMEQPVDWSSVAHALLKILSSSSLTTDCLPSRLACGDYTVELRRDHGDQPYFEITHPKSPNNIPVLSTPKGRAFIQSGQQDLCVTGLRGSYNIQRNINSYTAHQTVDRMARLDDGTVVISGQLSDKKLHEGEKGTKYEWRLSPGDNGALNIKISLSEGNFTHFDFCSNRYEKVFGFGEQYSHLNLKGHNVPVLVQEQGIGRGHPIITPVINAFSDGAGGDETSTGFPMPHFFTNQHRSFYLKDKTYSEFNLTDPNRIFVQLFGKEMNGVINVFNDPKEHIKHLTDFTGRMPEPPRWIHDGTVLAVQGGSKRVMEMVDRCLAKGIPIPAVFIQDLWGSRDSCLGYQAKWVYRPSELLYPNADQFIRALADKGVRVMGYINPMLVDAPQEGVAEAQQQESLYKEAKRLGYLIMDSNGEPHKVHNTNFHAGMVNLHKPEARDWYKQRVIKEALIDRNIKMWMSDYSESFPIDRVDAIDRTSDIDSSGLDFEVTPSAVHNMFPEVWGLTNYEAVQEHDASGECLYILRAGYSQSHSKIPMVWGADQLVSDSHNDGFASGITGLITGGLSGISNNHTDTGMYTSPSLWTPFGVIGWARSKWHLTVSLMTNAFTGMLRMHEGLKPANNVQAYDHAMLPYLKLATVIYSALKDYRVKLFDEAQREGLPLVRAVLLHYFDDPEAQNLKHQFLLGPDIMVAPPTKRWHWSVDVYLPKDEWVNLWTGEVVDHREGGKYINLPASSVQIPVFYRRGSEAGEALRTAILEYQAGNSKPWLSGQQKIRPSSAISENDQVREAEVSERVAAAEELDRSERVESDMRASDEEVSNLGERFFDAVGFDAVGDFEVGVLSDVELNGTDNTTLYHIPEEGPAANEVG